MDEYAGGKGTVHRNAAQGRHDVTEVLGLAGSEVLTPATMWKCEAKRETEDEQQGSRGQKPRLPIGIHQRPRYRSLGNPEGRVCPNPLPQPSGPTQRPGSLFDL